MGKKGPLRRDERFANGSDAELPEEVPTRISQYPARSGWGLGDNRVRPDTKTSVVLKVISSELSKQAVDKEMTWSLHIGLRVGVLVYGWRGQQSHPGGRHFEAVTLGEDPHRTGFGERLLSELFAGRREADNLHPGKHVAQGQSRLCLGELRHGQVELDSLAFSKATMQSFASPQILYGVCGRAGVENTGVHSSHCGTGLALKSDRVTDFDGLRQR